MKCTAFLSVVLLLSAAAAVGLVSPVGAAAVAAANTLENTEKHTEKALFEKHSSPPPASGKKAQEGRTFRVSVRRNGGGIGGRCPSSEDGEEATLDAEALLEPDFGGRKNREQFPPNLQQNVRHHCDLVQFADVSCGADSGANDEAQFDAVAVQLAPLASQLGYSRGSTLGDYAVALPLSSGLSSSSSPLSSSSTGRFTFVDEGALPLAGSLESQKRWGRAGRGVRVEKRELGESEGHGADENGKTKEDDDAVSADAGADQAAGSWAASIQGWFRSAPATAGVDRKQTGSKNSDDSVVPLFLYSERGSRVRSCRDLADLPPLEADGSIPLYWVPASEHFVWPVHAGVGHKIQLPYLLSPTTTALEQDGSGGEAPPLELEVLSLRPRILRIANFLSASECTHVQDLAEPQMTKSRLFYGNDVENRADDQVRNSVQAWVPDSERSSDKTARAIRDRVLRLVHVNESLHIDEQMQVLRYTKHQHYHSHLDYFPPWNYPNDATFSAGVNRLATVFYYLNDVEDGGETVFPLSDSASDRYTLMDIDYQDCSRGLRVKPEQGTAILWYHLNAGSHMDAISFSDFDNWSLHGGCDVLSGIKWAANKWIRNKVAPPL